MTRPLRSILAMALVAGIPAALIYALTRIGEKKA